MRRFSLEEEKSQWRWIHSQSLQKWTSWSEHLSLGFPQDSESQVRKVRGSLEQLLQEFRSEVSVLDIESFEGG